MGTFEAGSTGPTEGEIDADEPLRGQDGSVLPPAAQEGMTAERFLHAVQLVQAKALVDALRAQLSFASNDPSSEKDGL